MTVSCPHTCHWRETVVHVVSSVWITVQLRNNNPGKKHCCQIYVADSNQMKLPSQIILKVHRAIIVLGKVWNAMLMPKKVKRSIEIGWMHTSGRNTPAQVRAKNDGGTRRVIFDRICMKVDIVATAKVCFSPATRQYLETGMNLRWTSPISSNIQWRLNYVLKTSTIVLVCRCYVIIWWQHVETVNLYTRLFPLCQPCLLTVKWLVLWTNCVSNGWAVPIYCWGTMAFALRTWGVRFTRIK